MSTDLLARLDDATLLRQLSALIATERASTAVILAHIAEVDLRRLYLPAAYNSMYAYCVGALRLSEGAAFRRVQSARAARRCPRLFDEVASGRLNLTAITMLAPHLRSANADELIEAAIQRRSRSELAAWLAQRFPAEGASLPPAQVRVVAVAVEVGPPLESLPLALPAVGAAELPPLPPPAVPETVRSANSPTPAQANWQIAPTARPAPREEASGSPPAHPYFVLRVALDEPTHAKLERAQALLAHSVRAGEVAQVLDRALDALLAKLEARRGATAVKATPTPPRPDRTNGRNIPADTRREVWSRDRGRCTFQGPDGQRCNADRALEFDHALPVAKGGESTPENLRLRCRAHNQYEADRAFGREFMDSKRGAPTP